MRIVMNIHYLSVIDHVSIGTLFFFYKSKFVFSENHVTSLDLIEVEKETTNWINNNEVACYIDFHT